jgi:ferredoxin
MKIYSVPEKRWNSFLQSLLETYRTYAPFLKYETVDYEELIPDKIDSIYYASVKPTTPLKIFHFPVKENVVKATQKEQRIIIGTPACDLAALDLMDSIFLDDEFLDIYYKENRENTIIFGKDCYGHDESCHCTSYGLTPYPQKNCDVIMSYDENNFYLQPISGKGEKILSEFGLDKEETLEELPYDVSKKRETVKSDLDKHNQKLPDSEATRKLVEREDKEELWKKHAKTCVSCGACSTICPTCHCFLLIDRVGFEKIKNWDTCQHPDFERVAAGEDPLQKLYTRLRNRYLCKYSYKPDMFGEIACTGCGRCIEACIGEINKNELIMEALE